MKEEIKMYIRYFWVGGAMGVANIIPGVSGGTLAVVFGIYEQLMEALGNFVTDRENRWKYIKFLAVLFSGSIIAILSLAPVLSWAFTNHPLPTVYFFIGLIIGSIPVVLKSHSDMKPSAVRIISFLIGLIIVIALALMQSETAGSKAIFDYTQYHLFDYFYYGFCGAIAASAMIIPGVSGSFILILLGIYWTVLASLSGLSSILLTDGFTAEMIVRISLLGSLGIGIVIGILVISKVMSWALKNHPANTMYAILGLIVGSLYQIYPGFEFNMSGIVAIITLVIGFVISLKFGKE
jgi:putative membrane protein